MRPYQMGNLLHEEWSDEPEIVATVLEIQRHAQREKYLIEFRVQRRKKTQNVAQTSPRWLFRLFQKSLKFTSSISQPQ